jgi:hypothetical protein
VEQSISVIGKMTNNKDLVKKNGKTAHFIKETTKMEKKKVMAYLHGEIIVFMKVNFIKIIFKARESMSGLMEGLFKESGAIIKCMVKGFFVGRMVANMKDNTTMIKNMVLAYLPLKMVNYTKDNGKMVNNMDEVSIKKTKL